MRRIDIELRCRFTPDGVEVCDEITLRLGAISQARQLELPVDGLERQVDHHLRGLNLHDEAER